ncbi:MAG: hypothetical protein LBB36_06210 [Fibromonadaceae bacterium]|jgi:hypothetical protein|nr:hypothetical protein [Fibromonadaceae bacterium]
MVFHERQLKKMYGNRIGIGELLSKEGIQTAVAEYACIFSEEIVKRHIKPCLKECSKILCQELTHTISPAEIIAKKTIQYLSPMLLYEHDVRLAFPTTM